MNKTRHSVHEFFTDFPFKDHLCVLVSVRSINHVEVTKMYEPRSISDILSTRTPNKVLCAILTFTYNLQFFVYIETTF